MSVTETSEDRRKMIVEVIPLLMFFSFISIEHRSIPSDMPAKEELPSSFADAGYTPKRTSVR
jgi:hypothetical protein